MKHVQTGLNIMRTIYNLRGWIQGPKISKKDIEIMVEPRGR